MSLPAIDKLYQALPNTPRPFPGREYPSRFTALPLCTPRCATRPHNRADCARCAVCAYQLRMPWPLSRWCTPSDHFVHTASTCARGLRCANFAQWVRDVRAPRTLMSAATVVGLIPRKRRPSLDRNPSLSGIGAWGPTMHRRRSDGPVIRWRAWAVDPSLCIGTPLPLELQRGWEGGPRTSGGRGAKLPKRISRGAELGR
jgi:hypothetical protein